MRLKWDTPSQRFGEVGISNCVLFLKKASGDDQYEQGVAWNGIVSITEKPGGAEETAFYSDREKYASLRGYESFEATIEAYTYPDEFIECDGYETLHDGISVGQQERREFALCYKTSIIGADSGSEAYKLHIIYGATAEPSEQVYQSINGSPEAVLFSWNISTMPIRVMSNDDFGKRIKPVSVMVLDSRRMNPTDLQVIEGWLYGTASANSRLVTPTDIINYFYDHSVGI